MQHRAVQTVCTGEGRQDFNVKIEIEVVLEENINVHILLNNLDMESFLGMKQAHTKVRKRHDKKSKLQTSIINEHSF